MKDFFLQILFFLFPDLCFGCGRLGLSLCSGCFHQFPLKPHVRVLELKTGEKLEVICATEYEDGPHVKLLHAFKYQHRFDLARQLAPPLACSLSRLVDLHEMEKIVLVPIPLFKTRERERGYNQALELTRKVAQSLGLSRLDLLVRVRDTGSQMEIEKRADRMKNLEGAFEVDEKLLESLGALNLKEVIIYLVDDVLTSGATLINAAEALRLAGFKDVRGLVLCDRE
jgi:ComF family protein